MQIIIEGLALADFERQGEVIALMMYLGDPPKLNEHLFVKNKSKCLEMKQIAEETSFAYYECAVVDANLKGGKITSINEELEAIWSGQKTARQGLDEAVKRGNKLLRRFEAANR